MKKILLFLPVILIAIPLFAQQPFMQRQRIGERKIDAAALRAEMKKTYAQPNAAHKATGPGGSRWYSYPGAMDTATSYAQGFGCTVGIANTVQTIWNDTNGTENYTTGLAHNTFVSQGNILDPKARLFNLDPSSAYVGQIKITSADAYTCDSVDVYGIYEYNKTKTTFCDTLRLLFTKGTGGAMSTTNIFGGGVLGAGGHYSKATFWDMIYDSVTNGGSGFIVGNLHYQDILLCNSGAAPAWGDTNAAGIWNKRIAVNGATGISCSAGDVLGWTVTFISGDPETKGAGKLATPVPGDTLVSSSIPGENEYNVWRPLITYYAKAGTDTVVWAPYLETATPGPADHNIGLWKTVPNYLNGWDTVYIPMWEWANTVPSVLQYPVISWHVTCPGCDFVYPSGSIYYCILPVAVPTLDNKNDLITASPNPAAGELRINYAISATSDVSVSIINMYGQVVLRKEQSNISSGAIVLNTSVLPAGMYIYKVQANSEQAVGKVVIEH
jgi:Secretion system C-terminal sorting domain